MTFNIPIRLIILIKITKKRRGYNPTPFKVTTTFILNKVLTIKCNLLKVPPPQSNLFKIPISWYLFNFPSKTLFKIKQSFIFKKLSCTKQAANKRAQRTDFNEH